MYAHTHLFDETVSAFKNADEETILNTIASSAASILNLPYDDKISIGLLFLCPRYALAGKGSLSAKQKKAVDIALGDIYIPVILTYCTPICANPAAATIGSCFLK